MAFVGLWPFVGAVQAGGQADSAAVVPVSSSSVLWGGSSNAAGGFVGIFRFLGLPQASDSNTAQAAFHIANLSGPNVLLTWGSGSRSNSATNLTASFGALWTGVEISTIGRAALVGTSALSWRGGSGSALYIQDVQGVMSPTGASIVNSELIAGAAGTVQWAPTQVPTETELSIASSGVASFERLAIASGAFAVVGAASFRGDGAAGLLVAVGSQSGTGLTFGSETIQPTGPLIVSAAAFVQWNSLPSIFEDRDLQIDASGLLQFSSQILGPHPAALSIAANSLLTWTDRVHADDDDESEDDRRRIWAGAAEAEREALARSRVYDEEEFALLSAALAGALAQYRKGLQ